MRFFIYGDNNKKNIFNSKMIFKKNKYNALLISFDKALEIYDRYVSEKRFRNIYLIMDIKKSNKSTKQYDLDDTSMNWMLISASCNYGEICHTSDCSWATKNNSTVDFKSNRSMVKTYLFNIDMLDINIRFIDNNIEYNRIISSESLSLFDLFEDDQKFIEKPKPNPKGKFIVDYRRYKRLPQINRVPNVAPVSGKKDTDEYKLSDKAKESIQKSIDNCNNNVSFDELDKMAKNKKGIEIPSFLLKPNYAKTR